MPHDTISEKLKMQFQKLYNLRSFQAQKMSWQEQHANESCDLCSNRGSYCTVSDTTNTLACKECLKLHRSCSKHAQARKELIIENLRITAEQFDALNQWYKDYRGPKKSKKPPVEAKFISQVQEAEIKLQSQDDTDTPQFHVLLRQLKRDLEQVTTDLRFRRATPEEGVDMYDQIALKMGRLMEQYGVVD